MHPYCGIAPVAGSLSERWNLDPVLLVLLAVLAFVHCQIAAKSHRSALLGGWFVATLAFVSPLCALSVSLFSARVGQHMILVLVAAPLIASALPAVVKKAELVGSMLLFSLLLWFWHMPLPYALTFQSTVLYWSMHVSLFGSSLLLWRALLHHRGAQAPLAFVTGLVISVQMGLLGAVIALAGYPMYAPHYLTTGEWGLTPLADQQLGGAFMWVPGIALFLAVALRSAFLMANERGEEAAI